MNNVAQLAAANERIGMALNIKLVLMVGLRPPTTQFGVKHTRKICSVKLTYVEPLMTTTQARGATS